MDDFLDNAQFAPKMTTW